MGTDEEASKRIRELKERFSKPGAMMGDPTSIIKEIIEILFMLDKVKTTRRKYYGKAK